MPLTQPSEVFDPTGNPTSLLMYMPAADVYLGKGLLSTTELVSAFATQAALTTLLSSADMIGQLATVPYEYSNKPTRQKLQDYSLETDREQSIKLNLVGLTNALMDHYESEEFNSMLYTVVCWSKDKTKAICFNGMYFSYEPTGKTKELFTYSLTADFNGPSKEKVRLYHDIPATTQG